MQNGYQQTLRQPVQQTTSQLLAVRVMDGLFVGNAIAAQDDEFLFSNKVTHIINCAGLEAANIFQESGIEYLTFPFRDVPTTVILDSQDKHISKVTAFIEKAFEKGECVLIHSLQGISRSCTMIGAYLIYKYGWSLEHSLEFLHIAHGDMQIQVYFVRQLKALAKRKSRDNDIFSPDIQTLQLPLPEQQELLRNTFNNSLPYDEKNYPLQKAKIRHNKRVIFSEDLILKQRNNNLIDPTSNQKKSLRSILKKCDDSKPILLSEYSNQILHQPPMQPIVPSLDAKPIEQNVPSRPPTAPLINDKKSILQRKLSLDEDSLQLHIITGAEANQQFMTVDQLFQTPQNNSTYTTNNRQSITLNETLQSNSIYQQVINDIELNKKKLKKSTADTQSNPMNRTNTNTLSAPTDIIPLTEHVLKSNSVNNSATISNTNNMNNLVSSLNGSMNIPSNSGIQNTLTMSAELGIRKRPTTFNSSSTRSVSAPNNLTRAPNPPQKYRRPTPPKRDPQQLSSSNNGTRQTDPSFVIYSRKSLQSQPSSQQQQLFYRINRPESPNVLDIRHDERNKLERPGSAGMLSSGFGGKNKTLQNNSNLDISLNAFLKGEKRRPSSAPKNRTSSSPSLSMSNGVNNMNGSLHLGNSNYNTFRKSLAGFSSQNAIYSDDQFVHTSNSEIDNDDLSSTETSDDDPNKMRRKKKKSKIKGKASPNESRLMRPTLSFLRKTVKKPT